MKRGGAGQPDVGSISADGGVVSTPNARASLVRCRAHHHMSAMD